MTSGRGTSLFRFTDISSRQLAFCACVGVAALFAVRIWWLPQWIEAVVSGHESAASALELAVIATGGAMLVAIGIAVFCCDIQNRLRYYRQQRVQRQQREVEFLSSLGHSVTRANATSNQYTHD